MNDLLVRNVHLPLTDANGSRPTSVLITGGRIAAIDLPADHETTTTVLDGRGAWAMPGLGDIHCHLCYDYPRRFRSVTDPVIGLVATANSAAKLAAGVTFVRDLGAMARRNIELARAIADGGVQGPTMVAAGDMISARGGHMHHYSREVDSVADIRQAVADQLDGGAEWIKLMVSGGLAVADESWEEVQLSDAHISAAVEVAHERGVRVAAHAHPKTAILSAIANGCDTIEHATGIDEEVIGALLEHDVAVVPTLAVYDRMGRGGASGATALEEAARQLWRLKIPGLRAARAAGVRIGVGTDSGGSFPPGDIATEISLLVREVGISAADALMMASLGNAQILGLSASRGSITVGKVGDLVLVDSDPRIDLSALSRVSAVVKGGALPGGDVAADRKSHSFEF